MSTGLVLLIYLLAAGTIISSVIFVIHFISSGKFRKKVLSYVPSFRKKTSWEKVLERLLDSKREEFKVAGSTYALYVGKKKYTIEVRESERNRYELFVSSQKDNRSHRERIYEKQIVDKDLNKKISRLFYKPDPAEELLLELDIEL